MKAHRILLQCLPMLFLSSAFAAAVPGPGSISGITLDSDGHSLANVGITLTGRQPTSSIYQLTSGSKGEYRFAGLALAEYTLTANLSGYIPGVPAQIKLTATDFKVTVNLTLAGIPLSPAGNPSPAIEFQSSGIRGLIDPGGYSASTGIAATGLLRGITDVKRSDGKFAIAAATDWPCSMEPILLSAVAEHPDQFEANRRIGEFYTAHNQSVRAVPFLQRALATHPSDYATARTLGVAWLQIQDFGQAQSALTSLAAQHDLPEAHQLLARAYEGSGQFKQAALEYGKAMIEAPNEESSFGVGYEWMLAGSVADSLAAFASGVQQYPHSVPLHIGAGTARFLEGDRSAALQDFLDAIDIDPLDPRAYASLAAVANAFSNDQERVDNTFKRFLDLAPASAQANFFYALALSHTGQIANSSRIEKLLIRSIQLDSNFVEARLKLAEIYAQRNDYKDAVPEYESAVRLSKDPEAHYHLALAYKRVGRTEDSERELKTFRDTKDRKSAESSTGGLDKASLAQFISVMGEHTLPAGQALQCSAITY